MITCVLNLKACHGYIKRKYGNLWHFFFVTLPVCMFLYFFYYFIICFIFFFVDSLRLKLMEQSDKITELEESGNTSINLKKLLLNLSLNFSEHYFRLFFTFLDESPASTVTALRRSRKKCQTLRKQERRFLESVISNCKGMIRLNKAFFFILYFLAFFKI